MNPRVLEWFREQGWTPFPFQETVWQAWASGESGLIHATTGAGKTYAAWLGPVAAGMDDPPTDRPPPLRVLWITPLRALATDSLAALRRPIRDLGLPWTVEKRTSDTDASTRARQTRRLPTALVTTPESLTLLLSKREMLPQFARLDTVVVDEWHELLGTKRGVQAELALARLRTLAPGLRTWALSATLGNLEEARDTALGEGQEGGRLVRGDVPRPVDITTLLPDRVDRFPWAGHLGTQLVRPVVDVIERSASVLVFVNTRSQVERWHQALLAARPEWTGVVAAHHGSLDRRVRLDVEDGLRDGRLRAVVCTSSLDLGVDFSAVERVVQVGSPKGIARLLQRAGRSAHGPGRTAELTFVPTNVLELVEAAAARDAIASQAIEARTPLDRPLDVLVQHVVTVAASGGFDPDALRREVTTTRAFRALTDDDWSWVLDFVTRGGASLTAYPEFQRVTRANGAWTVSDPAIARRHRLGIGTIVGDAELAVRFLRGTRIGSVEESFAARLRPGDRFVLAGRLLQLVRVREGELIVRRTTGVATAVPRWLGGRLPLSTELADAVRARLDAARRGTFDGAELAAVRPLLELQARWSAIPGADELLVERWSNREGHHLFLYPFAGRAVHEGLAVLFAQRLAARTPLTFSLSVNDYGLSLLSPDPPPLGDILDADLFSVDELARDVLDSLNASEMARRQFREIARIAGLLVPDYPGRSRSARQLQASSNLFFDVFRDYDPDNRLLHQASREVLERQLEQSRLVAVLRRLGRARQVVRELPRPSPLAFPLLVDRMRERVSSETLVSRVERMQRALERAADREGP